MNKTIKDTFALSRKPNTHVKAKLDHLQLTRDHQVMWRKYSFIFTS